MDELVTDRSVPITAEHVNQAKERLILFRTTHLDSLSQRLRDPKVSKILHSTLLGDDPGSIDYASDDFQFVVDLGMLKRGKNGAEAANPLYREVLARQMSYNLQESINAPRWRWATPEGRLDFPALVVEFLKWWRRNADAVVEYLPAYPEALPHLALMAFLQRVVNGGGQVHREYSSGRGAVDLVVEFGPDRVVVEIKRVRPRDGRELIREEGIVQLCGYLDSLGENEG